MSQLGAYISQLTPLEQKVLQIAASHLETSFSLVKSIGFQEWQHKAQAPIAASAAQAPAPEAQAQAQASAPLKKIKIKKRVLSPKSGATTN